MLSERRPADRPLPPGYGGATGLESRLSRLLAGGGTLETIGSSAGGRSIRVLLRDVLPASAAPARIDRDARPPERILALSLLHPMEWIGLEAHLALLESWFPPGGDGGADALPAGTRVASIPVAHPDGFAEVEASWRAGRTRWIRGSRAGVDLNRNFPVGHRPRGRLLARCPLYRPGAFPLSEPETAAIAAFARRYRPTLAISLHSFGRWIFVPPARRRRPLSATPELLRHARAAAAGTGYRVAPLGRWSPLFLAGGTELDFLHEELGARAFLVEVSGGGFARWGWRRIREPFTLFNPAHPGREIARLLPALRRLAQRPAPGAALPGTPSG